MKRLLILGGTSEARLLAQEALAAHGQSLDVITSWAGRTGRAPDVAGLTRVGGFGGTAGLVDYIKTETIDMVIDATHPFAETISDHAYDACVIAEVPRLLLVRPPWRMPPDAKWVDVEDMAAAAEAIAQFARRAFLSTGKQTIEAFTEVENVWLLVRLIDPPPEPLALTDYEITCGRPPFSLADEKSLMQTHNIDTLVSKSSGGEMPAKIVAAVEMQLPIVLVAPPPPPPGNRATSIADALAWIKQQL
jgi:precorrin-6A/cobalt-precorrin-6A reductase